jgi:hypothetical protein
MPNGRPGDHPLTDVVLHQAEIYGRDIDDLIREVAEREPGSKAVG